jgi:predicted ATPase
MADPLTSIFISYNHADSAFVDRLDADLRTQGFDTWVDRERLVAGLGWRRELQEAVERAQVLLIVLSPEAIASQNVQIEYDYALDLGKVVIPVYYRQCNVPMELPAIQWVDFRHSYEQGIAALVQVLRMQQDKATLTPPSEQTRPSDPGQQRAPKEQADTGHPAFNNLPAQLTALIGRQEEIQAVCGLLHEPEVRLVTLTGTGGVGKTRLGLAVAQSLLGEFADGVCFVSLASISNPNLVAPTIAQVFSLREVGDQSPLEQLKAYLREKQLLLFLDNFEQLLEAAVLLTELLEASPSLEMLVTSRAVLNVGGEHTFLVPTLVVPNLAQLPEVEELSHISSVALFLERASAVKPHFEMTPTNAASIAELCLRLEGLPLAIELAAARIKLFSPQALLSRLSQRLQLLTGGPRTSPARQQTLRSTLQWSYDLLRPEERLLFRLLSVFLGGWTLEAAEALCQQTGNNGLDVLNTLSALLDNSLIQQS